MIAVFITTTKKTKLKVKQTLVLTFSGNYSVIKNDDYGPAGVTQWVERRPAN